MGHLINLCMPHLSNPCTANLINLCMPHLSNPCTGNLINLCMPHLSNNHMVARLQINMERHQVDKTCLAHHQVDKTCLARHRVDKTCSAHHQVVWMLDTVIQINMVRCKVKEKRVTVEK
jgi:hypothetical protein